MAAHTCSILLIKMFVGLELVRNNLIRINISALSIIIAAFTALCTRVIC